jgi:hypothetical protein
MKSTLPTFKVSIGLLLGAVLASGCSTVIKQSYEGDPATSNLKVASFSGSTAVYGSTDPEGDGRRLVDDEYAKLGSSKFTTARIVKFEELQSEANDVGADIVLLTAKVSGSMQYLKPMALNPDHTPYVLAPYAHASTNGPAAGDYAGAPQQTSVPSDQEFDYMITFWRKAPKG